MTIDECTISNPRESKQAIAISLLVEFGAYINDDISCSYNNDYNFSKKNGLVYSQTSIKRVMDLEYAVWLQLDDLIQLLQHLTNNSNVIPAPQSLGLLPKSPPYS